MAIKRQRRVKGRGSIDWIDGGTRRRAAVKVPWGGRARSPGPARPGKRPSTLSTSSGPPGSSGMPRRRSGLTSTTGSTLRLVPSPRSTSTGLARDPRGSGSAISASAILARGPRSVGPRGLLRVLPGPCLPGDILPPAITQTGGDARALGEQSGRWAPDASRPPWEDRSLLARGARDSRSTRPGDTELEGLVTVGALTGMRRGELLGLRRDAVDLEARTLKVVQQIAKRGKSYPVCELSLQLPTDNSALWPGDRSDPEATGSPHADRPGGLGIPLPWSRLGPALASDAHEPLGLAPEDAGAPASGECTVSAIPSRRSLCNAAPVARIRSYSAMRAPRRTLAVYSHAIPEQTSDVAYLIGRMVEGA